MDKWKRQDINNLDFKELCESFYYYKRKKSKKSKIIPKSQNFQGTANGCNAFDAYETEADKK